MAIPGEFRWPPVGRNRCPLTLTDDLQVLLSVASHVGPAIDTLPAPRRSGCTDRDAAPLQEVAIEVGGVREDDLLIEMGQVPFEGAQFHGLEVDEDCFSVHDKDVESMRGAVEHMRGIAQRRQSGDAIEESTTQKSAVIPG